MTSPDDISQELEKAASMVITARRLLATGTMVDLSALEGKVRAICQSLAGMAREEGRVLLPTMERLIRDLDQLAEAITERMEPPARAGGG